MNVEKKRYSQKNLKVLKLQKKICHTVEAALCDHFGADQK
jgi:hypothetical protein